MNLQTLPQSIAPGVVKFGDVDVECHILGDGRRILVLDGLGGDRAVEFNVPGPAGGHRVGVTGEDFVDALGAIVDRYAAGKLPPEFAPVAETAGRIIAALARVGVEAMRRRAAS